MFSVRFVLILLICIYPCGTLLGTRENQYYITHINVEGAYKTNHNWLLDYLDLKTPTHLRESELNELTTKLMKAQTFIDIRVSVHQINVDNSESNEDHYALNIEFTERWTLIPVIRGAIGGGTPLQVYGVYDLHALGRLWTLGAELHQYGNNDPGGVLWARAPRWKNGNYTLSFEVWKQNRLKTLYDTDWNTLGELDSRWDMFRVMYLNPLYTKDTALLQLGLDFKLRSYNLQKYTSTKASSNIVDEFDLQQKGNLESEVMFKLIYDDILVNVVEYDGLRFQLSSGSIFYDQNESVKVELEAFYYYLFARNFNLASHLFVGVTDSKSMESQYFLGGFDSLRGIPDGAVRGKKSAYLNLELRKIALKTKHVWLQGALFLDAGSAGADWHDLNKLNSTAGIGLRIHIPRIQRFSIRVDYGWNLKDTQKSGISAGTNELFTPYKPL